MVDVWVPLENILNDAILPTMMASRYFGGPYLPRGELYLPRGELYLPRGEPYLPTGEPYLPTGEPPLARGGPYRARGEPYLATGEPYLARGEPSEDFLKARLDIHINTQLKQWPSHSRCLHFKKGSLVGSRIERVSSPPSWDKFNA